MIYEIVGLSGTQFIDLFCNCLIQSVPYVGAVILVGKITNLVIGAITGRGLRL